MNWKCFFGWHHYILQDIAVIHYIDIGYESQFLWKCNECQKIKSAFIPGNWIIEKDEIIKNG